MSNNFVSSQPPRVYKAPKGNEIAAQDRRRIMRHRKWLASFAWIAGFIAVGLSPRSLGQTNGRKVPVFDVDTTFPNLPNNCVLGNEIAAQDRRRIMRHRKWLASFAWIARIKAEKPSLQIPRFMLYLPLSR